jgi:uncharacterized protein (TIGR02145 family)
MALGLAVGYFWIKTQPTMRKALILALLILPFFAKSQVTDHKGQTYKTVKIGNQTWMAENLNVTKFRDGEEIPLALTEEEWWTADLLAEPAYTEVLFDLDNGKFFGKLYNSWAATDPAIAPEGWRVPTDEDWNELARALGGQEVATAKLKSAEGWLEENGTDESGFTAFPVGMIDTDAIFQDFGYAAYFWSSTIDGDFVINRNLGANKSAFVSAQSHPGNGLSIRLIKID